MSSLKILLGVLMLCGMLFSQEKAIPLWGETVPNNRAGGTPEVWDTTNAIRVSQVRKPLLEMYLPDPAIATGQTVVIFPGGGYKYVVIDKEGSKIAKMLNAEGIAAAVVLYRLPDEKNSVIPFESPLMDAARAVRLVRSRAAAWKLDPGRIGVMGFSAGGHLAASFATQWQNLKGPLGDAIDRESARPDFAVLMYPVITMKEDFMHRGSRDNLLGENPAPALVERFSPELCVGENTPPALLIHAGDDRAVPVENSLVFYQALIRKGIAAEMHLYPVGGHGFGLAPDFRGQTVSAWPQRCVEWLKMQGRP